ncbi:MAG: hypothetical protein ACI9EF_000488 [Pseudohongiellaceae bacterium]|jgi:hypothetical protein
MAIIGPVNYLIDGYNLAFWLAGDDDLEPLEMRELLLGRLRSACPKDASSLHIYWDVRRPNPSIPAHTYLDWCTMHNVPDADAAIIDAVYDADSPRHCLVVSRDREVTGRSKQLGAKVMSPDEFFGGGQGHKASKGNRGNKRRKRR